MNRKEKVSNVKKSICLLAACAIVFCFSGTVLAATDAAGLIGLGSAKETALTNAGITMADTHYCSGYLKYASKKPSYYQIEFVAGATRYYYQIDAHNGAVLSSKTQSLSYTYAPKTTTTAKNTKKSTAVTGDIGQAAATQAALSKAGVTQSQTEKLKVKRELKSSGLQYQVEFKVNKTKYKYTIDGITGQVIK